MLPVRHEWRSTTARATLPPAGVAYPHPILSDPRVHIFHIPPRSSKEAHVLVLRRSSCVALRDVSRSVQGQTRSASDEGPKYIIYYESRPMVIWQGGEKSRRGGNRTRSPLIDEWWLEPLGDTHNRKSYEKICPGILLIIGIPGVVAAAPGGLYIERRLFIFKPPGNNSILMPHKCNLFPHWNDYDNWDFSAGLANWGVCLQRSLETKRTNG